MFRLLTSFRYVWDMSLKLKNHTSRHCCRNSSEKLQQNFIIIGMRSYFLKKQLQMQSTGTSFGILYVYEVIIKCYPYFITCLYFPLPLIRWNSSHCHLIELFKTKECFKKKVDSDNNWKTAWPRMILERYLFLKLSSGSVGKTLSFAGKNLSF